MHSPGRSELSIGLFLMIPGVIAAVFVDALPVRVLVDPRVGADSIVGALFIGTWGLFEGGAQATPVSVAFFGLVLLSLLYYVGAAAVIMSVVSIVRS